MIKIIKAKLIHETQKAYRVRVELTGNGKKVECWFPKSYSFFEDNDTAKAFYAEPWLVDAKSEELGDDIVGVEIK